MSGYLCLASLPSGSSFWTTQTAEGSRGDRPPLGGAELAPFGFRGLLEQERARHLWRFLVSEPAPRRGVNQMERVAVLYTRLWRAGTSFPRGKSHRN